ncbi:MAG: tetratricopeptide repeat protein [Candidatus Thermoplasmatota archaeon]|jgi:tetratricopeptide (TPR) repeat protein|nr:tetratricopeptide repeat protein [Candidatus Thermoplasmatota archaeon]
MLPTHERSRTTYVGRKEELGTLSGILKEVAQKHGRLVLVDGEAGIGKTRLIEEMKELPEFKGFTFLSGRCLYFKDTDIYLPFKDMFNQYRKLSKSSEDEASPFSVPDSSRNGGTNDQSAVMDDFVPMSLIPAEIEVEVKEDMVVEGLLEFDKLSRFIFKLAGQCPVCLFVDDLHWADPPSIKLLQYLAPKIQDHSIMIICTYRPEDLFWGEDNPHPLSDPLKRLSRDKLFVPLSLKRLTEDETDNLIQSIMQIEKVPQTFGTMIFKRTNGNPFFIEEVIYSLLERDVINPLEPEWSQSIDPETISLPTTLKDIILRRMHWLNANSMNVIRLSSVSSGTRITFDIIKDSLNMKDEDVLEALEELVQAKFLKEITDEERYDFENPVIQEIVYSELNHSRRRFLHTKMALVLETKYRNDPLFWGNIGTHYYRGKDLEKALHYLTRAASYYQKASPHKALEYLHMVLDCIEKLPQSEALKTQNMEVLLDISDLCLQIGDWKRSLEFSERALNLATVLRQPSAKVRAKNNMGELCKRKGDFERALTYYNDVVSSTQETSSISYIAQAYMGMGYINWRKGDLTRSLEMFSKSLQYAKSINDANTIGSLYLNIGNVFNHRGDQKKAIDYYSRGVKHLESIGNLAEVSRGYNNLGNVHLMNRETEEAEKYLHQAIESAKEQGRQDTWWPTLNLIHLRALQGRYEEASSLYDHAIEDIRERDDKVALGVAMMYMGDCRSRVGDPEEAESLLLKSISSFESLDVLYELSRARYFLGEHYIRIERFDEARSFLTEAYQSLKNMGALGLAQRVREKLLEVRGGADFI